MLPILPVDLAWNAPAECPSREAVLDDVGRVLAQSPEPRAHAAARADVTRGERGQWHAALSVDASGAHSERGLDAESCQAIATATALIVAVAVEGGMPEPTRKPPAPPPSSAPPAPALPTTGPSQLVIAAAGVIDGGFLPAVAPGGEMALGWIYRASPFRIRATAGASLFGQQSATLPSPAGESGRFAAFAASARGCASVVNGPLEVGTCLGVEVDTITASGSGPSGATFTPQRPTGTWPSVLGSAIASWSFSRHVAIFLRVDGVLPLAPPTFGVHDSFGNQIPLHQAAAGPRAAFGVETRFF